MFNIPNKICKRLEKLEEELSVSPLLLNGSLINKLMTGSFKSLEM